MLEKCGVKVTNEEHEQLDSMRFQWSKMSTAAAEKNTLLVKIQPEYKGQLVVNMSKFNKDQAEFLSDYNIKEQPALTTCSRPIVILRAKLLKTSSHMQLPCTMTGSGTTRKPSCMQSTSFGHSTT